MKFKSLILCLLLLAVYVGAADQWGAFSNPFPIHDVVPFGDKGILLATDGGIRYRALDGDLVYHSDHGLETSKFYSIVGSSIGYYAVSEYGLVAVLGEGEKPWIVLNRSYVKNNIRAIPHGAVLGKTILVIAFEDRLAFFDLMQNRSLLTIDRIGDAMLSASPIQKMVVHGDSLYVKMEKALYVRKMDWDHLSEDKHLVSPSSWASLSPKTSVAGLETLSEDEVNVDGVVLKDSVLYYRDTTIKAEKDTVIKVKSWVKWQVKSQDGTYLVGPKNVFYLANGAKKIKDLTVYQKFPLGATYELQATPVGGVLAASVDGKLSYGNLTGWKKPEEVYGGLGNAGNAYTRMKVLSYLPDGHVFYHIWGLSFTMYSQWGEQHDFWFRSTDGLCLDTIITNYTVSFSTVPAPDKSGFLSSTARKNGHYGISYFTKDGEVSCASQVGSRAIPGAMYATFDDDGNWLVYTASRTGTVNASSGELDVHKFKPPKSNGGQLEPIGNVKTYGGISPTPIDIAYDSVGKRLWIVSMSSLVYLDEEQDTLLSPTSTNGMVGPEYTSIDVDVHGNLWVGTANQGVFRLTPKNGSPDTLVVKNFTTKDGLLDNSVLDVAIDHVLGIAWFAHDNGVSYYQRKDLRDASKNMTDSAEIKVYAYPIPFRPKIHERFTIEGVTENSVVSIYNRGGALIKSFREDDLLGGKVEWDGCDKIGKFVAPGVYYYVVKDGSKVKKGKFIVVH